ncbi:MAG TPA: glycosyltransferase family 39 protein [Bryobacteraceae bacterium]|nr:glycosyltransferase family 39 protein [Bryobacteraceae bacterium]
MRFYTLLIGVALVYFAFLTRTYYWDGVLFSLNIESVRDGRLPVIALFHPNHLVYNAVGYAFYSSLSRFWPGMRAITALQIMSVIASVGAACLMFLIAKNIVGKKAGVFSCLLFAAGATWWKFSTDADAYSLSIFLLLLGAFQLLRDKPNLFGAALCHAAAMLLHELAVFSYISVLAWILIDNRQSVRRRWLVAVAYCAGTGAIVSGTYWLCYSQANHKFYPTVRSWTTSYASDSSFTRSASDLFVRYPLSYLKLFAGGKLSLMRQFFSIWECGALFLCVAFLALAIRAWKGHIEAGEVDTPVRIFLWAWLIGYSVFFAAWDPGSAFHKLFVWPPIVLLIAVYARTRLKALTWIAASLAAWNFGVFIYPHSRPIADPVLVLAKRVNAELPRDATVYYRVLDPDDWYLEYFAPGRQWKPLPVDTESAGPVCLETTALNGFQGAMDPTLKWDLVNSAHNIRLECLAKK